MAKVLPMHCTVPNVGKEVTVVVGEPVDLKHITCRWAYQCRASKDGDNALVGRACSCGALGLSELAQPVFQNRATGPWHIMTHSTACLLLLLFRQGCSCNSSSLEAHPLLYTLPCPLHPVNCRCNHPGENQQEVWRDIAAVLREALLQLEQRAPPNPNQVREWDCFWGG